MTKIIPFALKRLRAQKGWTQDELARRAKLNKQTICRLESGSADPPTTRKRTLEGLAAALATNADVLTGKTALTDAQDEDSASLMSKLNFRVSNDTRNALYLVSERYDVTQQEIVELAPYLFCWAAEASLRQRRERLSRAERACREAEALEREIKHLPETDFSPSEEKFEEESRSIEARDIFGMCVDGVFCGGSYDMAADNPFARFLAHLAYEMDDAKFKWYGFRSFPEYDVCLEDAASLVDGDRELTDRILDGHIPLHEMPKELRDIGKAKERAEWARAKLEELRKKWRRSFTPKVSASEEQSP